MERLVKIIVETVKADKAKREIDAVLAKTEQLKKSVAGMNAAQRRGPTSIVGLGASVRNSSIAKAAAQTTPELSGFARAMQAIRIPAVSARGSIAMLAGRAGLAGLMAAIGPVLGSVGLPAIAVALGAVGAAIGPALVIMEAFKGIGEVFGRVWDRFNKVLSPIIETVKAQLEPAFLQLEKALNPLFGLIAGWLSITIPLAVPIIKGFISAFAAMLKFIADAGRVFAYAFDLSNAGRAFTAVNKKSLGQIMEEFQQKMEEQMRSDRGPVEKSDGRGGLGTGMDLFQIGKGIADGLRQGNQPASRYDIARRNDGAYGHGF